MSRIRVLVVDDSAVACKIVADALGGDPQIEVIGTAADGRIALTMVEELAPDLITMDLEMPLMDGVETVRALRRRGDRRPIIVFTAASAQDAKATFTALAAGATDFVTKPSNMISSDASLAQVAEQLIPRIKALVPHPGAGAATSLTSGAAAPVGQGADAVRLAVRPKGPRRPVRLVVMGASMGGPDALSHVLRAIPRLPVPVVLVQHMPPVFTRQFAARLDSLCASTVLESVGGRGSAARTRVRRAGRLPPRAASHGAGRTDGSPSGSSGQLLSALGRRAFPLRVKSLRRGSARGRVDRHGQRWVRGQRGCCRVGWHRAGAGRGLERRLGHARSGGQGWLCQLGIAHR